MKRRALISFLCILVCFSGRAAEPLFTFGVEWGVSPSVYQNHKFIYTDEYGSTVSDIDSGFKFDDDAFLLLKAGLRPGRKSEIFLMSGISGIGDGRRCIPVMVRYNFTPAGRQCDGPLVIADGGMGFPIGSKATRPAYMGKIGGGYRLILASRLHLDLMAGIKFCFDHPCDLPSVRRNDAFNAGVSLGVALGF